MISLKEYIYGSSDVEKLMAVQFLSSDEIKKQSKKIIGHSLLCILGLMVYVIIIREMFGNTATNNLIASLLCGVTFVLFLFFVMELWFVYPNKKLEQIEEAKKLDGVYYSACGYVWKMMEEMKTKNNVSYKDGVVLQARQFTLLDLWAIKNLHKILRKQSECKALYL